MDLLKIIMILITHYEFELHQMDVKIVFLNGDEKIYVELKASRIRERKIKATNLKKSIYDLK